MLRVNIIGAGLAGLSAAVRLAQMNIASALISVQTSERAQSVLAEGGINAAMNVSGENDTVQEHFEDTMRGGVCLADPGAVRGLTQEAPVIVQELLDLGVPFNMEGDALVQRRFGGQKKTRTTYARSSTGKALMTAMIDAARRYENTEQPLILRYPHHRFQELILENGACKGVWLQDTYTGKWIALAGPVILAFGGPNGLFPGRTTGTTANDAGGLATVFAQGVELANLEFIQYHPTTVQISGKRMLISEAARGEGGRLYVMRGGQKWFFMEEKYPELGNLMPRDVVSREMYTILRDPECQPPILLDLTGLPKKTWQKRLPDLRKEIRHYLNIDPARQPVPVSPGIHFFMGGILVDREHRTNIPNLYAAGECACQYHGANRLGGNSLLGALYGGRVAAQSIAKQDFAVQDVAAQSIAKQGFAVQDLAAQSIAKQDFAVQDLAAQSTVKEVAEVETPDAAAHSSAEAIVKISADPETLPADSSDFSASAAEELAKILSKGLGIIRDETGIDEALRELDAFGRRLQQSGKRTETEKRRLKLAEAMLLCARERKESRGAHTRADFPARDDENWQKTTAAVFKEGKIHISFREIPLLESPGNTIESNRTIESIRK